MMRLRFFLLVLELLSLTSVVHAYDLEGLDCPKETEADWTIMLYINGDSDLEPHLVDDLYELAANGSTPLNVLRSTGHGINVVALVDTTDYLGRLGYFMRIESNLPVDVMASIPNSKSVKQVGVELNMSSGDTLSTFISLATICYPAKQLALLFNGHGSGSRGRGESNPDAEPTGARGLGRDSSHPNDTFFMAEIAAAIKQGLGRRKLDLIGFDACLMSTISVFYAVRSLANAIVASADLEGPKGWDHKLWLGQLHTAVDSLRGQVPHDAGVPALDGAQLGKLIAEQYKKSIENGYNGNAELAKWMKGRTLATVDLDARQERSCVHEGIQSLSTKMTILAGAIDYQGHEEREKLATARVACDSFGPDGAKDLSADLACILESYLEQIPAPQVVPLTRAVLRDLYCAVRARSVDQARDNKRGVPSGLALFFPKKHDSFKSSALGKLFMDRRPADPVAFFQDSGWDLLLVNIFEGDE